jgi:DNA-binding MarR family transcriptional regulator
MRLVMNRSSRAAYLDAQRLRESIAFLVHKVYTRFQRMRPHSLQAAISDRPVVFEMMMLLGANPGIRQADIARGLSMDKSNVASMMHSLEDTGWVSRRRQIEDGRCFGVFLTPVGVRQLAQLQAEWQHCEQELTAPLEVSERRALVTSLQQLLGPPENPD